MNGTLADPLTEVTSAGPVRDIIVAIIGSAYVVIFDETLQTFAE